MANIPTITITVRLDDRERQAIREWMDNALAALAIVAWRPLRNVEDRARFTASLAAMEQAAEVLWEDRANTH